MWPRILVEQTPSGDVSQCIPVQDVGEAVAVARARLGPLDTIEVEEMLRGQVVRTRPDGPSVVLVQPTSAATILRADIPF